MVGLGEGGGGEEGFNLLGSAVRFDAVWAEEQNTQKDLNERFAVVVFLIEHQETMCKFSRNFLFIGQASTETAHIK